MNKFPSKYAIVKTNVFINFIAHTLLFGAFIFSMFLGNAAIYLILLPAMLLSLIASTSIPHLRASLTGQVFFIYEMVFAAILLVSALGRNGIFELHYGLNFIALAFLPFCYAILSNTRTTQSFLTIALYALVGSLVAATTSIIEVSVFNIQRAAGLFSNPIHFGGAAAILGTLSLIGFFSTQWRWRPLLLLGPLAAFVAILASQARGPLLIFVVLIAVAIFFMSRRFLTLVLVLGLGGLVFFVVHLLDPDVLARSTDLFRRLVEGDALDRSSQIRLELLEAGWQAFLERPWFGHGWNNLITAASPFLPDDLQKLALTNFNHLHNDAIDFAVGGGLAGLFIYLAILAAPVGIAFLSPRDPDYRARVIAALILALAYAGLGLTNMMFGQEFHTALYAIISAAILASGRKMEMK